MNVARTIAVVLSLLVHGTLAYAMIAHEPRKNVDSLEAGSGDDAVTVEQGIAIEGLAKLGDAQETIETAEVTPIQQATPPPIEEIKPIEELRNVITSESSVVQDDVVKTEEPPPPDVQEKPPEQVQVQEQQPEQVAIVTQQSSGDEKSGGNPEAYSKYLGQINQHVQRSKINPRSRVAGTVVMKFTVGLRGELISKQVAASSGHPSLDNAAIAALERAAPFPPIPPEVSTSPLAFTQPFRFIMR
ncbi:MAG: energy transducer TonB family protein [Hyphomicrobium sp.]